MTLNARVALRVDSDDSVAIGSDGWVFWARVEGPNVRLRCGRNSEGRLVVTALHMQSEAGDPIQAVDLRQLPLGAVEVLLNDLALEGEDPDPTQPEFDPCRVSDQEAWAAAQALPLFNPTTELTIDGARDRSKPQDFYLRVARAYAAGRRSSRNPVRLIAEANQVPETTVRRWIRTARDKGVMAPGRRQQVQADRL